MQLKLEKNLRFLFLCREGGDCSQSGKERRGGDKPFVVRLLKPADTRASIGEGLGPVGGVHFISPV